MIFVCPTQAENTTFALDALNQSAHQRWVESSQQFLERLKAAGVTQTEIAKVLGIAQPNAATFYTPAKNGKLRTLKWDEGAKLLEAFADRLGEPASAGINEGLLLPMVREIVANAKSGARGLGPGPLAEALARYLRQILSRPSIHASPDALEAVAQAVVPQVPESRPPA